MPPSLIAALLNIKKYGNNDLSKIISIANSGQPRVNKEGGPLEAFIKDAFCNSFSVKDPREKMAVYLDHFSYLGSQNNPPDLMIRGGDAIEIKKVRGLGGSSIALNSSYPKSRLHVDDDMITAECKNCEPWKEKDIVYCVGHVVEGRVSMLIFVYGDCYAADAEVYKKVRLPIVEGLKKLNLPISRTRELARLNKVDPLQITDLRVRGMWQIKSPLRFFSEIIVPMHDKRMSVFVIMKKEKFERFGKEERDLARKSFSVSDIKIKSPENPQKLIDAILISFAV